MFGNHGHGNQFPNVVSKLLFSWLHKKSCNIIFLQETHSIEKDEQMWKNEWGGEILYSHGSNDSCGVSILIKNNCDITVLNWESRIQGRFLIAQILINDIEVELMNIYAPNDDDVNFITQIFNVYSNSDPKNIVAGGDFNLVLDIKLDKIGGIPKTHEKSKNKLLQYMEQLGLVDIWRIQHPNESQFTWRRKRPTIIQCRLDFFLVSDTLHTMITNSNITYGHRSDHSLISITITPESFDRGPGYWKLNCSLLQDKDYIKTIKTLIETCLTEFLSEEMDDVLLWEMLKMKIREKSIQYSSKKKKIHIQEQLQLESQINRLEQKF